MQLDFSAIRGNTALDMAAEAHIKPIEQPLAIKQGNTQEEEIELDLSQFRAITEAPRKQEQAAGLSIFYHREQQEVDGSIGKSNILQVFIPSCYSAIWHISILIEQERYIKAIRII